MLILPIRTGLLKSKSVLAEELLKDADLKPGDILVVSSKAVATCEGAAIDLQHIKLSKEAVKISKETKQNSQFTQAVLNEVKRLKGSVVGTSPSAILTELRPRGMKGIILCPNAGMDQSNISANFAIGWPKDPVKSAMNLKVALEKKSNVSIAIIISDSCCLPSRAGVTAFALSCAGIRPVRDERGSKDLFGNKLKITQEAIADQLATAANTVMGNANQSIPAAIIREHNLELSEFVGWVDGIEPKEDIFNVILPQI